ncbi:unnamed protein product [Linum trigynum]|uniref:Uncharacterized protein n=1 Tax=Linum trigynum TaxID=586398 RepID=A0AAV2FM35_9ROSI
MPVPAHALASPLACLSPSPHPSLPTFLSPLLVSRLATKTPPACTFCLQMQKLAAQINTAVVNKRKYLVFEGTLEIVWIPFHDPEKISDHILLQFCHIEKMC